MKEKPFKPRKSKRKLTDKSDMVLRGSPINMDY